MAEQLGGLTQAGASAAGMPDPAMDPLKALQAQALDQNRNRQNYLEQQQNSYNNDMAKYAELVAQSRIPENNQAARWGAVADAMSSVAPTWGNLGAMIGKGGAAYGQFQEQQQQADIKNQLELTKLRQAEVRALESKDQSLALQKMIYGQNRGFEPRRNADGTTTVYDRNTGMPVGTYGPQDISKITQLTQTLAKAAVDKGDYKTLDEAMQWAHGKAIEMVTASNAQVGNRSKPLGGDVGGVPTTQPEETTPVTRIDAEGMGKALAEETQAVQSGQDVEAHNANLLALKNYIQSLPPDQQAAIDGVFQKYLANPSGKTLSRVATVMDRTGAMPKLDVVKQAGEKETATKTATVYATQFEDNVVKPAAAFANTGKIMQDFNTLGEMKVALKNGKLKEFMAGDAGKYALTFLPENSDLRKGIANAQEAEKLTAGMVNQILLAAKGVQTEGDAQRARSQVTSVGTDPDANRYLEAYISETARQLKLREQMGLAHKNKSGSFEGYDTAWNSSPIMKDAKGSVKRIGTQWIGLTQYIDKFKAKNPGATDADAVQYWNKVK